MEMLKTGRRLKIERRRKSKRWRSVNKMMEEERKKLYRRGRDRVTKKWEKTKRELTREKNRERVKKKGRRQS